MTAMTRRTFLKQGTVSVAALTAMAGPFGGLVAQAANGPKTAPGANGGYGPLLPIPEIDGKTFGTPPTSVLLHLPEGFQYRLLNMVGQPMSDGFPTPARADGMAAFSWRGGLTRLIRNHEVTFEAPNIGPSAPAYDRRSGGGTTTLEVTRDRQLAGAWISLNGTNFNCAGGATPWGTWITCEETVNGPDANQTFIPTTINLEQQHGYLFEVPVSRGPGELVMGEPITAAGRFAHEAVAIDPATGIVYMTEDDFAYWSGLFRYVPPNNPFRDKRIENGGLLQVLGVVPDGANGPVTVNLSNDQEMGVTYRTAWIDIEEPNPTFPTGIGNDPASRVVFQEGESKGGAQFSRLEGIDYWGGRMYVCSTEGGGPFPGGNGSAGFGEGFGQVWVYDTHKETLTLLFESPDKAVLDLPDNITISPRRKSVLLCEDNSIDENKLRGLTQDGLAFDFALNVFPGRITDEFAGATFSADTQTLYVNLQATGATFAIWGPWERGLL